MLLDEILTGVTYRSSDLWAKFFNYNYASNYLISSFQHYNPSTFCPTSD